MNNFDAVDEPDLMQGQTVGSRVRSLRKLQGLTVKETAAKSGVSAGMISQIERGLSNPSVRVLERLRLALDVPLTALLASSSEHARTQNEAELVRRRNERPSFTVGHNGMSKELLSPNGDHDLQFMIITVAPHSSSQEVLIGPGEKAGLMLEGELELRVGSAACCLLKGIASSSAARVRTACTTTASSR